MPSARQELLRFLAQKSFQLGNFTLSSGGSSDYYVDCRATTLDARGAQLTGQAFLEDIGARDWHPQAIASAPRAPIASGLDVLVAENFAPLLKEGVG